MNDSAVFTRETKRLAELQAKRDADDRRRGFKIQRALIPVCLAFVLFYFGLAVYAYVSPQNEAKVHEGVTK